MESSLYSCIQAIQDGDKEQSLAFLEKFSPLLKKYAYFLQTEDALQELQCFLLAFVKNLHLNKLTSSTDGAIISYINKTIYHHYIALSKGNRNKIPTVSMSLRPVRPVSASGPPCTNLPLGFSMISTSSAGIPLNASGKMFFFSFSNKSSKSVSG